MTLVELLVASGLASLILIAVLALTLYSARSFAALTNYVDLDNFSRSALDRMTMEIRQADRLVAGDSRFMRFQFTNPTNAAMTFLVTYAYSADTRTLWRIDSTSRSALLEECDFLEFSFFRRNPIDGTYDQYPAFNPTNPAPCKLVQLNWICSRQILGEALNTESVQSAKIVIRKQ